MPINKFPEIEDLPDIDPHVIKSLTGSRSPVLVVGMHNSGTSILTEILHKNGIFFGVNMQHYESYFFSRFINDRLILGGEGNWAKLPIMSEEKVLSYQDAVEPIIREHWLVDYLQWGYDCKSPWGIKDPRLCVLLPLYLKIFPTAKVVHITRIPEDIAASLTQKYKQGVGILNDFDHWKALSEAYVQRVHKYASVCEAYFELTYEDFCTNPIQTVKELFEGLSLSYTPQTEKLLEKVTPTKIGSYQQWQAAQKHPWRSKFKSLFGR